MNREEKIQLLRELHRGETSRNRDFARFQDLEAHRVWRGYRRIHSLLRELRTCGVTGVALSPDASGTVRVAIDYGALCYRRVVSLAVWEAQFFLEQAGEQLERKEVDSATAAGSLAGEMLCV